MGDLFGFADPPVDGLARQVIQALQDIAALDMPAAQTGAQHGGIHRAGQDGIAADVIAGEFDRHRPRQGQQPALAGSIGGNIRRGCDGVHRGDIDNRPTPGGFEQRMGQLNPQEGMTAGWRP